MNDFSSSTSVRDRTFFHLGIGTKAVSYVLNRLCQDVAVARIKLLKPNFAER
jgi:hypothetical protein